MKRISNTIVLVHGLWLTPRSFDNFRRHFALRGYTVHVPAWPGIEGEVEKVRKQHSALAGLGLRELVESYENFLSDLPEHPILMGHGVGGLLVQILLDRGWGVAGAAIASAPPRGVWSMPLSAIKFASCVLRNPLNLRRTVSLTFPQFRSAFANQTCVSDARFTYDRYAIPGPGRPAFQIAAANFNPYSPATVNFKNSARAPLLLVAGTHDRQAPPAMVRENYRCYAHALNRTDYFEFPRRSHLMIAQCGWQDVADGALSWCEQHARLPPDNDSTIASTGSFTRSELVTAMAKFIQ